MEISVKLCRSRVRGIFRGIGIISLFNLNRKSVVKSENFREIEPKNESHLLNESEI